MAQIQWVENDDERSATDIVWWWLSLWRIPNSDLVAKRMRYPCLASARPQSASPGAEIHARIRDIRSTTGAGSSESCSGRALCDKMGSRAASAEKRYSPAAAPHIPKRMVRTVTNGTTCTSVAITAVLHHRQLHALKILPLCTALRARLKRRSHESLRVAQLGDRAQMREFLLFAEGCRFVYAGKGNMFYKRGPSGGNVRWMVVGRPNPTLHRMCPKACPSWEQMLAPRTCLRPLSASYTVDG
jgi:hypothetical protein